MTIVKTVTQSDFQDALKGEGFSYDGTKALYDYIDALSDDLGEPYEFDAVAIRCDWMEYTSLTEAYHEYKPTDLDAEENTMLEYFEDNTQLIKLDNGGVLVQAF
jgi:hypothetical protein